ncbi:MAG: ATP-grasp domain protein [Candidatus Moranbacteria bacterium GW2011_GWC2_45_10]|nr:MAG: ATP-grasp domain protein [Candidatus Moranbacteria bacterium GW2011_GWC2_45_10]
MGKSIVTIYYEDDWGKEGDPISSDPTRRSFEDMHERGITKGVEMYRASIKWYDTDLGIFSKAWAYREGKWIKVTEPVKPDLVFDKVGGIRDYELFDLKMKISTQTKIFNHPMFRTLLDNKLAQYLTLGDFMPKTLLATDKDQFEGALEKISTEKVVLKPPYGSGGFGILITEKRNAAEECSVYPVLVQEFIQNESGIPGFSNEGEVADLRMVFFNHQFRYALSRIAKSGSLFTNFHQGATAVMVPEDRIPENAKRAAMDIVGRLSIFKEAQYSLDFMFTKEGEPLLIEMNTTPGVDLLKEFGDEQLWEQNFNDLASLA